MLPAGAPRIVIATVPLTFPDVTVTVTVPAVWPAVNVAVAIPLLVVAVVLIVPECTAAE